MSTLFYSLWVSLFDSLSTTLQIVVFVLLLATAKPLRNAFAYLAGLSGAYFACGLAGYLALDELRLALGRFFPSPDALPGPVYYESEFLMGLALTAIGIWYYLRNRKRGWPGRQNWILSKLRAMNAWFAFGLGLFISATSFPLSLPYLVSLGRYSALHLGLPAAAGWILVYNLGYASPMVLIMFLYLAARRGVEDDHDFLRAKAKALNLHLTAWTLVGFGLLSMLDAGCYFVLGQALLKERFF